VNILTIIGSPKGKGSGYKISKKVEKILSSKGNVSFEYLLLKNFDLKMCIGCFQCVKKGIEKCPIDDSFKKLEEKINKADGIIVVSPGYVYNVSWLMKNFIDRFAYTNHRPKYFDKKIMLIANSGAGMDSTLKSMENVFGAGPEIISKISYITPEWELKDSVNIKQDKMLAEESEKFYKSIVNNTKPVPTINDLVRFNLFKKISEDTMNYLPADYKYYKDKEHYYYKVKISPVKRLFASLLTKFVISQMKDLEPKKNMNVMNSLYFIQCFDALKKEATDSSLLTVLLESFI